MKINHTKSAKKLHYELKRIYDLYLGGKDYIIKYNEYTCFKELILIRLVSVMEVFLSEEIQEIFIGRKDLFYTEQKISFDYYTLLSANSIGTLWGELITKKCRSLQAQGFNTVKKFYEKTFHFDFSSLISEVSFLNKIYDMRHLLVHKLGHTDEEYRKKYNYPNKFISVSTEDLECAFASLIKLSEFIDQSTIKLIQDEENYFNKPFIYYTEILLLTENIPLIFNHDYSFSYDNKFYLFKDIAQNFFISEKKITLRLAGKKEVIKNFLKIISSLEKEEEIKILNKKTEKDDLTDLNLYIAPESYNKIKEKVTGGEILKESEKEFAKELGLSKSRLHRAIKQIKYIKK